MVEKERTKPLPKIQEVSGDNGAVYKTRNYGDVEVLEYFSSLKINIKFLNTGNVMTVSKYVLERGAIRDNKEGDRINLIKQKIKQQRKIEADAHKALQKVEQERIRNEKIQIKLDKERYRIEALENKALKRAMLKEEKALHKEIMRKSFLGSCYLNKFEQSYQIIENLPNKRCKVLFSNGNTEIVSDYVATHSKAFDKNCDLYHKHIEIKEIQEIVKAKLNYLKHKDKIIARAVEYKKNFPESVVNSRTPRRNVIKEDGKITDAEKSQILKDQDCKCVYCKIELTEDNMQEDHILPFKLGGRNVVSNLQFLCQPCNSSKGSKHPDYFLKLLENDEYRKLVFGERFKPSLSN